MIVQEYDIHTAIFRALGTIDFNSLKINKTIQVNSASMIVHTNMGPFLCESFEDVEKTIYMRVERILK